MFCLISGKQTWLYLILCWFYFSFLCLLIWIILSALGKCVFKVFGFTAAAFMLIDWEKKSLAAGVNDWNNTKALITKVIKVQFTVQLYIVFIVILSVCQLLCNKSGSAHFTGKMWPLSVILAVHQVLKMCVFVDVYLFIYFWFLMYSELFSISRFIFW